MATAGTAVRARRSVVDLALAVVLGAILTVRPEDGRAADLPRPDAALDFLVPDRLADAHPRWTAVHRREAAVVGELLAWPEVSVGGLLDSNPFHERHPRRAVAGVEIMPRLLVEQASGLHRTEAYASGDLRLYPDAGAADAIEGRAGVLHDWLLRPDLTIRLQGDLDRHTDPLDTATLLNPAARRALVFETDALASGSVQKSFDRLFVLLSGTALRAHFATTDGSRVIDRSLSDETVGTGRLRVGYLFPSSLYVFAEPSANGQELDRAAKPSTGTRVVAGAGIARFGLIGGELFAGAQRQSYPASHAAETTPVVGGRVAWTPRRDWTVSVEGDEGLGQVAVATRADALGTPTRTQSVLASVAYAISPLWRAQADAGLESITYVGTARADRLAFADLRVDYALSRSFDLTGLLRVADLHSSLAPANYQRAAATLAASYHY